MGSISEEAYQRLWAKACKVFLPFTPITLVELFHGRKNEIRSVVQALKLPGRHVVLFGERGVGKTSLANLISFFANWDDDCIFSHSCSKTDTFSSIFDSVFTKLGQAYQQTEKKHERKKSFKLKSFGIDHNDHETFKPIENTCVDANSVFNVMRGVDLLIILDEFDRVCDEASKDQIAELAKKLSDDGSLAKLLIVGVASTIDDLIGSHPSSVRCFEQVPMPRMSAQDVSAIFDGGFKDIELEFPKQLKRKAVNIADGFPHFAHLIGLKLAEACLERLVSLDGQLPAVMEQDYFPAIAMCLKGAFHSLQQAYIRGTETTAIKTDMYKWILEGMAIQNQVEVEVKQILQYVNSISPKKYKLQSISPHLGRLVSEDKRNILERPRKGIYRFRDPMLRAYIRMKIAENKLEQAPGYVQLELDFV